MKDLILESKVEDFVTTTPYVNFNAGNGVCEISGESYMDNTYEFFDPLFNWIIEYTQDTSRRIKFVCKLSYYNTGTSGCLYTIMETLKEFEMNGGGIEIEWYYKEDDIDMEEDIQDLMQETGVEITMIAVK